MPPITWIHRDVAIAIHEAQLAEHGGLTGLRDAGLLDSALGRAPNMQAYSRPDLFTLAAAYGYAIARNHPFLDGNKRTAFVATVLFLHLNGYALHAPDADCVITMLKVAAGNINEESFAAWLRLHARAR